LHLRRNAPAAEHEAEMKEHIHSGKLLVQDDGETKTVWFDVLVDWQKIDAYALRAYRNKKRWSKIGPFRVEVSHSTVKGEPSL
jgi:hypothetical protein